LIRAVRGAAAPHSVAVVRSFGEPPDGLINNQAARDRSMLSGVVDVRAVRAMS
jgi:hypothetical protein